jgi:hypothetical protein
VSEVSCKASYGFGWIVDTIHRRKGIASQLEQYINKFIEEKDVDIHFVIIIEGNTPAVNLAKKLGYTHFHDFPRVSLVMHEGEVPSHPENIRGMKEGDVDKVAELLNEYYSGFDFYKPFTGESLLEEIERYPFFGLEDINLYENEEGVQACLGTWDYDKIVSFSVLKAPQELIDAMIESKAPFIPEIGEKFINYTSHYLAYRDEAFFNDLMKYTINSLHARGAHYLTIPINHRTRVFNILTSYHHTLGDTHIYAKLKDKNKFTNIGENHVYIEAAHL